MTTLPAVIREPLVLLRSGFRYWRFRYLLRRSGALRLVIGASGSFDPGWIPTDIDFLDLLEPGDWTTFFHPNSIDAILAEHVWEHLMPEQALIAARQCYRFLKPGGYMRVAVPDGLHPDLDYIASVCVGGTGPGAKDHKVLYTHQTFADLFAEVGFEPELLEYYDENGVFHYRDWSPEHGKIRRSCRYDSRNTGGEMRYTSIIIDAHKR
jgi:predicted SAM-dependent methyltransferase